MSIEHFNLSNRKKLSFFLELNDKNQDSDKKKIKRDFQLPIFNYKSKKIKTYNLKKNVNTDELIQEKCTNNLGDKLRDSCMQKLIISQFRIINEYLYTNPSFHALRYVDEKIFKQYHEAYSKIVDKWPVKPLDIIKMEIEKLKIYSKKNFLIADMGCGEAYLSEYFNEKNQEYNSHVKVYSFDLVSTKESIIKASMDNVPLEDETCDVVVFCLSLMSTNLKDCFIEASRILKINGNLFIIEVSSRFEDIKFKNFKNILEKFNFEVIKQKFLEPNNYFVFFELKKKEHIMKLKGLPRIQLKPCKYKLR